MIGEDPKNSKEGKLVAVYGTLRKGHCNHYFVENSDYFGTYTTRDKFIMISIGPYPIITPEKSLSNKQIQELESQNIRPGPIVYELYDVSPTVWKELCELEVYSGQRGDPSNEYDTMDIYTEKGLAEIFIQHSVAEGDFISNGDYTDFVKCRNKDEKTSLK